MLCYARSLYACPASISMSNFRTCFHCSLSLRALSVSCLPTRIVSKEQQPAA